MDNPQKVPTITSKNIPAPPTPGPRTSSGAPASAKAVVDFMQKHPEVVPIPDDDIKAMPLDEPDFVGLQPKNPNCSLRYVNYVWKDGLLYNQWKYRGFRNATPADLKSCPSHLSKEGGTKIINGDTILMIIDSTRYRAALKFKDQKAIARASRGNMSTTQEKVLRQETSGAPLDLLSKIKVIQPTDKEVEAMTSGPVNNEGVKPMAEPGAESSRPGVPSPDLLDNS